MAARLRMVCWKELTPKKRIWLPARWRLDNTPFLPYGPRGRLPWCIGSMETMLRSESMHNYSWTRPGSSKPLQRLKYQKKAKLVQAVNVKKSKFHFTATWRRSATNRVESGMHQETTALGSLSLSTPMWSCAVFVLEYPSWREVRSPRSAQPNMGSPNWSSCVSTC